MNKIVYTKTFEQTRKLGAELAENIGNANVLALHGDLGSGKTTFIQGFAHRLGIKKRMISPTFIIMRTYEIPQKEKKRMIKKHFYHVDLYRIEEEKEVEGLGLLEIMHDPKNIVAIEWPEAIESLLPKERIDLYFEYIDETTRKITMEH